ncbi:hypothetical protein ACRB8A_14345 [Arthrobacter sp. G.S.26]|uniref:hypothetical protein n=1 Tax=Arthrobacter sp. G.S.26 TaxID=3433706 RepID=UPI003D78A0F7
MTTQQQPSVAAMKLSKAQYIELCDKFRDKAQEAHQDSRAWMNRALLAEATIKVFKAAYETTPTGHPHGSEQKMTENSDPIQDLRLSKERYAVGFGPNVAVMIAAGANPADESVYILTPHMKAPEGVGFVYTLREKDAVALIRAVYLSLSPFSRITAMTALEGA